MGRVQMFECDSPLCKELGVPEPGGNPPYNWVTATVGVVGSGRYAKAAACSFQCLVNVIEGLPPTPDENE